MFDRPGSPTILEVLLRTADEQRRLLATIERMTADSRQMRATCARIAVEGRQMQGAIEQATTLARLATSLPVLPRLGTLPWSVAPSSPRKAAP